MAGESELETKRKRLLYRSVYRGNKENDVLLGQFARAHIADFTAAELPQLRSHLTAWDGEHSSSVELGEELVLAVNELATNSIRHGGGEGGSRRSSFRWMSRHG